MRIAIDIRRIGEFGIGAYIWNLVRNIAAVDSANEYLLIGSNRKKVTAERVVATYQALMDRK